jgi:hypothetical protein
MLCSGNVPSASLSTLSPPQSSQDTSHDHTSTTSGTSRDMARIKHVKRARPQDANPDENRTEDTTCARPPRKRGRPRRSTISPDEIDADNTEPVARPKRGRPPLVMAESVQSVALVLPVAPSTKPKSAPAAFPSLTHEQPLHLDVDRHHGLRQRVGASTDKDRKRCSKEMDAIYESTSFPKHMDTDQRGWYQELKGRWLPDNVPVRVSGSRTTVTHACPCVVVSRSFRITDKPRKSSSRTYTLRSVQQLSSKYTTTLPRVTTSIDTDRSKRYSAWTT